MNGAAIDRLLEVYTRVYAAGRARGSPQDAVRTEARRACLDFIEFVEKEHHRAFAAGTGADA